MTIVRYTPSPAVKSASLRTPGILNRTGGASVAQIFDARRKATKTQK